MRTLLKSLIRRCLGIGNVGMIRNFAGRKENQDQSRIHSKTMLLKKKKKVMSIIIPIFHRKQEGRLRMVGGKNLKPQKLLKDNPGWQGQGPQHGQLVFGFHPTS